MGPRNAYKDMLDNVVSPITCVSMNHQNQLKQMANGAMFAIGRIHHLVLEVKLTNYHLDYIRRYNVLNILTNISFNTPHQSQPLVRLRLSLNCRSFTTGNGLVNPSAT
jgi:hypothetical protein